MKEPFSTASYSFNWALGIVLKLRGTHARGTDVVERILGISDRNLAAFLAKGDPLWPKLKTLIHLADRLSDFRGKEPSDAFLEANVEAMIQQMKEQRLVDRLTGQKKSAMLSEQLKRGSPEAPMAEGDQPYVLEDGLVQYTLAGIL